MADFCFEIGVESFRVTVEPDGGSYGVTIGDRRYQVNGQLQANGQLDLVIDGQYQRVYIVTANSPVINQSNQRIIWLAGQTWTVTPIDAQVQRSHSVTQPSGGSLTATMPSQVRALLVAVGDVVTSGDPLIILEAMKMEIRISAPRSGSVAQINCAVGDVVARGQLLIELAE